MNLFIANDTVIRTNMNSDLAGQFYQFSPFLKADRQLSEADCLRNDTGD